MTFTHVFPWFMIFSGAVLEAESHCSEPDKPPTQCRDPHSRQARRAATPNGVSSWSCWTADALSLTLCIEIRPDRDARFVCHPDTPVNGDRP